MNFEQARHNMVEQQVRTWGVLDARVLEVLGRLPRESFVAHEYRRQAYSDLSLPLGHGQHMLKPVVEGRCLQALQLSSRDQVLQIGTGSGYLTACLAELAGAVTSLEYHADLARAAEERLSTLKIANTRIVNADALSGYAPDSRFDVIVVAAAMTSLPESMGQWLRPDGRLFGVFGSGVTMEARLLHLAPDGQWRSESLFDTVIDHLIGAEPKRRFQF